MEMQELGAERWGGRIVCENREMGSNEVDYDVVKVHTQTFTHHDYAES